MDKGAAEGATTLSLMTLSLMVKGVNRNNTKAEC
jgi:hypothetical protein